MVGLSAMNSISTSYSEVKWDVRKGIHFISSKHAYIYGDAKLAYNILGPILVILVEDEIKMKG